ncbi:hypothetical protein Q4601_11110 [Shewanella sp. 1_MG-2023]|uniref:Uncharacterized protein n=1 Tax=Shewanella electrodiphila TaxID=934143 RepID=A0ABT0KTL2_9GAMM|nr:MULTISPECIES: hypothetical protein [Shewanella]MCL1047188.1 hypothetical protein [Shewanella electrodiphila]MDO6612731.1 hypothetical protein [Shewanella sp. 7_MG-2023]MDO6772692.1 hypothetical protein [Shewanella sp. 2_MG-2023]MDO6794856.1 hypothetical protein [Shewanella sp. 1_MG-2023]
MRNNLFLIGLVNVCLSSSAYALSPDAFTSLEYHVNTGTAKTLPYAASKQTDDFKQAFNFIDLEERLKVKLVTYIDTPNRAFKAKSINIRVREDLSKPRKSKITVKLRAADPQSFGDVSNYRKAEIDYTEGKAAYSVSYDIPYSPADIDVKNVDMEAVFAILKRNTAMWEIVGDIYEANKADLIQTMVMRTHGWEGTVKDKRFDDVEVDFQVWTPYYRKPRISFNEFSFKGHVKDKARLEEMYQHLYQQIEAVGYEHGHSGSKTSSTFKMSKGFTK